MSNPPTSPVSASGTDESPTTFGQFREQALNNPHQKGLIASLTTQFNSYLQRRDVAAKPGYAGDPRHLAWQRMIDIVGKIGNKELQASLVNDWVNTMVKYDDAKFLSIAQEGVNQKKFDQNWMRLPQDTLRTGTGTCADIALLKYETLRRLGFQDRDMRLTYGMWDENYATTANPKPSVPSKTTAHMVLRVNAGGVRMVLNDQQIDFDKYPMGDKTPKNQIINRSLLSGQAVDDFTITKTDTDPVFCPIFGYNGGTRTLESYVYDPKIKVPDGVTPERQEQIKQFTEQLQAHAPEVEQIISEAAALNPFYVHSTSPVEPVQHEALPPLPSRARNADHRQLNTGKSAPEGGGAVRSRTPDKAPTVFPGAR